MSISLRMASDKFGSPGWSFAHAKTACRVSFGRRNATTGSAPVAGLPFSLFRITFSLGLPCFLISTAERIIGTIQRPHSSDDPPPLQHGWLLNGGRQCPDLRS